MEEIKDKAFDDELNKAHDTIESKKRDKTPLPPHHKKHNEEGETEDEK